MPTVFLSAPVTRNGAPTVMHRFLVLTLLAIAPATALAQEDAAAGRDWSGNGELGLAIAKGNTDSETLTGGFEISREDPVWRHSAGASFLYGKSDGVETAYRYDVFAETGYRLTGRSYLFGSVRNERDHFASYEYQWTASAGYGFEAIKSDATQLTFEIGPGYRWSKLQGVQVHNNETIVRGSMDFAHAFNGSTSIYDTLLVESGSDNTFAVNDVGVKVKMSEHLALKAGLETRYNTDVQPGIKNTDNLTTINIVYDF